MDTPIYDFVTQYIQQDAARLHMPGHKGAPSLGCELRDITEIPGADALYEAAGIIARSEENAARLFQSGATFYSTEGSSQCLKAMVYLALSHREDRAGRPVMLSARNAHKSLIHAAALCDFDVMWLWPEAGTRSICACPIAPGQLRRALLDMPVRPFGVMVTSPDYLGGMQDIRGLAQVCHEMGVPLLVDNAHGAYLHFLPQTLHPLDLGADLCCDSAHKTLPALTGGAYLHVSKRAEHLARDAREALSLFGSTSPSYLILQSLDLLNLRLAGDFPEQLEKTAERVERLRTVTNLALPGEPMKLTLQGDGRGMAEVFRSKGVVCEYVDHNHVVLMFSPDNRPRDFARVESALRQLRGTPEEPAPLYIPDTPSAMTIRQAVFAPSRVVAVEEARGRICALPTVSCPPAIPVAVSGEIITPAAVEVMKRCGIDHIRVVED